MKGWLDTYEKAQKGKTLKRSAVEETRPVSKDRMDSRLSRIPTEETVEQVRHNEIQRMLNKRSEVVPHTPQSKTKKALEVALNPMTAVRHLTTTGELPDNFSRGERNATDYALDVINPIHYVDAAKDVVQGTATGDLMQAGVGALGILPLGLEAKNIARGLKKRTSSIDNVRTENLSSGIKDTSQLLNEVLGEITQGSKNRKSIAEGNRWLEEWIKHPSTQKKIRDDIRIAKEYTNDDLGKLNELYLIEQQSKNFKPNTKEFSFLNQIDDTVQKFLTGDSQEHIHRGNWGVSYSHNIDPLQRMYIEKGLTKPSNRHGSWVSRTPLLSQEKRIGTTIHEGTHDWVSDRAIKVSGMWNRSLKNTDPEILSDFRQWKSLREQGKNPVKEMGREKAYQAYLANPTEMHARLMELRKHLGHAPDTKVTPEYAKQVIDYLEKLPRNKRPIDVDGFLNVIEDDPAKLSELFNKFWAVPPAVIGTQGLMNQKESKPQQQLKNGGWLDSYQDGGNFPKRKGVRKNLDGSESTHLMKAEKLNDSTWVGFPTLFQNPDESWVDMSKEAEKDWMPVYQEALKRNEVRNFGRDSISALKYGEGSWKPKKLQEGGVIKDDRGQWAHPGEVTEIGSNQITMQNVNYPVLGISDVGDVQLMQPEQDYKFKGEKVTELPLARFGTSIKNKNNLHNFTQPTTGGWLDKYN